MPVVGFPIKRRRIVFEANVHAPLDLANAVIPDMQQAGEGWIVNLSSGSARLWDGPPFQLGSTAGMIEVPTPRSGVPFAISTSSVNGCSYSKSGPDRAI